MTYPIDRADAVKQIANHLADRDRYIITAPPDVIATLGRTLDRIPEWTAYLDGGMPLVLCTTTAGALLIADMLVTSTAVITVPKTIPPATIRKVVGDTLPDDGSQDLVILHSAEGEPIIWPMLFVEALEIVEPDTAMKLRAYALPNLS